MNKIILIVVFSILIFGCTRTAEHYDYPSKVAPVGEHGFISVGLLGEFKKMIVSLKSRQLKEILIRFRFLLFQSQILNFV